MRERILWVDGTGGAVVGVLVLLVAGWLSRLYQLPHELVVVMGVANLAYGTYSLSLARSRRRTRWLIVLLVVANLAWTVVCFRWVWLHADTASVFGLVHLAAEGLWVAGLACLEWRWRDALITAQDRRVVA